MNAAAIATALADRTAELCSHLLPNGKKVGREWVVGSLYGEAGRSLSVHLRGPKAGVWADFATDEQGDALDLVAAVLDLDMAEAIKWARDWLGGACCSHATDNRRGGGGTNEDTSRLEFVRHIWGQTRPLLGTLGERYLRQARCIDLPVWPSMLRLHPRLKHGPSGNAYPAIVCAVQAADGEVCGIWRIFLDPTSANKAPIDSPRMGLGRIAGGAVRLTPIGEELVIGEGVETCLAVLCADPTRRCWAGLSASMMRRVVVPSEVRRVLLLEENDQPDDHGRRVSPDAVRALAKRLLAEGHEVLIVRPPAGYNDMNDCLMSETRHVA
jgi:hypothetical protein